jgi:hypothetical protein
LDAFAAELLRSTATAIPSGIGWYGFQPGDRRATIAAVTQRGTMIQAVIDALRHAAAAAN